MNRISAARFHAVRATTLALAAPLSPEDCVIQSMPDASPVKWHLAHTSWFFETFVLSPHLPGYQPNNPAFRVLYNSYYHAVGARHPRPERGLISRPDLAAVLAYRRHVDTAMAELLAGAPSPEVLSLVELGLNHEQQHQELILTDVKHLLSRNPLSPAYRSDPPVSSGKPPERRWVRFERGLREIGHQGTGFAFDNESPRHRGWLDAFELASHPVTTGEFLAFLEDGGYRRPELWLSAGWDVVTGRGWEAPLYWECRDGRWFEYTLHGEVELDLAAPACHLSFFEAEAFARWAGARLPTEVEWEVAAAEAPLRGNFLDSGAYHPRAPEAEPANGALRQLFGDVWEWTRSDYNPYPGFKAASGAVGEYNGKFMCGQYVLRGGSCATPATHIRATYRNFFPPDARWQFSGLRLARDSH